MSGAENQYNQYNADRQKAQGYENAYNTDFQNRQNYGNLMNEAENKYGVDAAKNTYQDSLRAVAATNQAMNTLPSTINANSNVILNQAQRNAALSNQMNKYQNTLASWQQQNAVDQSALNLSLQQAAQLAAGNYQSQQDRLNAQMAQYQNAYAIAQQSYQNALNERQIDAQKYAADAGLRAQQFLQQIAQEQQKNKIPTFADYLQSAAAYEGDWADDIDKDQYLNNMLYRWIYGDDREKQQIMSGSNYQDYMNRIRRG